MQTSVPFTDHRMHPGRSFEPGITPLRVIFGDRSHVVEGCPCSYCTWVPDAEDLVQLAPEHGGMSDQERIDAGHFSPEQVVRIRANEDAKRKGEPLPFPAQPLDDQHSSPLRPDLS